MQFARNSLFILHYALTGFNEHIFSSSLTISFSVIPFKAAAISCPKVRPKKMKFCKWPTRLQVRLP